MPKDISVTREEGRRIAEQAIARDAEKEVLLDVENLHVTLFTEDGALPAITDLSFVMRKGETLAVVGESGCGKSMTALSIMGLLPQPPAKITGGQINFDGTDLAKLSRDEMRAYRGSKMGMIFQEPMTSLNPVMTAGKQIREGILVHNPKMDKKEADARALEMIKLVGIPAPEKVFRSYPHELSGGMRQRVMIAIALACQPDLLICDEPTTALDVTIQAQILQLIDRRPQGGVHRLGGALHQPQAPLHARPHRLHPEPGRRQGEALRDPRQRPHALRDAHGLPLPPALPLRQGHLPQGDAGPLAHRRRREPPLRLLEVHR